MEKKILNPFRKFYRNIILGLCLLLSVFCFVPALNITTKFQTPNEVMGYEGNVKVKVYYKDSDSAPKELDNSNISYYKYGTYGSYDARVYARVNAEARNGESADATYPGKTYELSTANAYIDALVQTEVAGGYVVGYFKDTNFNADSVISFGDKVYAKDIPSDITKDSEGAGIIYLLVSKTSFSLVHTSNLQVGNYTWQSEYVASTVKTIKLGQIIDLTTQDEYDTQFEKILKRTDNYNEAEEEILSSCQYYILQTGKSSSNKRFSLVDVNDRNNVIKDLIDLRLYYKPTDENTKIQLQGEEVVFNIYDSTDLEKFAKEVNNGFMNKATKDLDGDGWCYYTAVLKNTLKETYTGPSIGTQASPFMGTFNGNGQTIESIVMPTTGTATIFGFFQEVQHGKISDLKIDSIGPSTVSVKGASCIGALCAYANNAIFEKIVINEIYLNIKYTATDGNLYVGGLVGKCSNTTFDEIHLNENKITMSGSKDADETNHYFGGIVGYSANTSYRGITNKYKLSGTWPKLNGGNFYGGGIVGYAYWVNEFDPISDDLAMINVVNENISDDSKDDAEQSYQLYNTNSIYIGGLIGYAAGSGYRIIDSQNNADIIADFAASSSANANSDTVHLGGLIGCIGNGSSGVQIENCRNTGDIKNAQTDNTNRALRIGGLFGGIYEQKTTVNNCSVFNNTLDIAFKNKSGSPTWAGLFVGAVNCSASNTINFNNCYASLADIVKTSSSAGASLSGHYGYFPSNQNPNNLTFSNCYAMGNFIYKGTSGEERILPDGEGIDHRNGIGVKKEYYGSREPTENNGESYVNEILNLNENGKYLYGYNTAINSVSENLSTPFAITEYFKSTGTNSQPTASYVNVIIDCSSYATQESSIHVSGTDGQGQFYNYKNQYFYGTGLLMMESGTRYPMKLPELTGKINGSEVAVSGYSLSEDNPEIEFIPGQEFAGDLIGVSDIYSNETIRLYPVFAPSVQVYTTTKIKNNIDTATRPIQVGDRVYVSGDTYTRVFVEDTSANTNNYPYYEISAINEIEEENSLYKYVYTITYNDTYNDATEYKSNLDCRAIFQLFGGIYTTSGIQSGFFKTSLDEYIKDEDSAGNYDGVFEYDCENLCARALVDEIDDNETETIEGGSTIYLNFYISLKLYSAELIDPDNINSSEASYSRYVDFFQYLTCDGEKGKSIRFHFTNLPTVDDNGNRVFTDITVSNNGKTQTIYSSTGMFTDRESTKAMDGNPNIIKGNDGLNFISEDNNDSDYYLVYLSQSKYVILKHHDINGKVMSTSIISSTSTYTDITDGILTYEEAQGSGSSSKLNYAFVGWEVEIYYGSTTESFNCFIHKAYEFNVYFNQVSHTTLNLYPVFVKKDDKILTITEEPKKDGNGVYLVDSPEDLIAISYIVNNRNEVNEKINFKLTSSINMSGYTNFLPIGYGNKAYRGNFDGQGYTISNLTITERIRAYGINPTYNEGLPNKIYLVKNNQEGDNLYFLGDNYVGLFGLINSSEKGLGNVNLINIQILESLRPVAKLYYGSPTGTDYSKTYMGGFAGRSASANIYNVLVEGKFLNGSSGNTNLTIGGIIGDFYGKIGQCIDQCIAKISVNNGNEYRNVVVGTIIGEYSVNRGNESVPEEYWVKEPEPEGVDYPLIPITYQNLISNCFDLCDEDDFINIEKLGGIISSNENNYLLIDHCYSYLKIPTVQNPKDMSYSGEYTFYSDGITAGTRHVKSPYGINCISNASTNSISFANNWVDGDIWGQDDNVNGGLPYLKNTGIITSFFRINEAQKDDNGDYVLSRDGEVCYVFTDLDKERLAHVKAGDYYEISKDFFILDEANSFNTLVNELLYTNQGVTFNALRGYTFTGLRYGTKHIDQSSNLNDQNIVFQNNNAVYNVEFVERNDIVVEYFYKLDGNKHKLAEDVADFAMLYKLFREEAGDIVEPLSHTFTSFKVYVEDTTKEGGIDEFEVKYNEVLDEYTILVDKIGYNDGQDVYVINVEFEIVPKIFQVQYHRYSEQSYKSINEEGTYFAISEGSYNDFIDSPELNYEVLEGYNFVGWAIKDELLDGGYRILSPEELESFTYQDIATYTTKATTGVNANKYILQVSAVYKTMQFTIEYVDGENILATQNATYNTLTELLSGDHVLLHKEGYHVVGFEIDYEYYNATPKVVDKLYVTNFKSSQNSFAFEEMEGENVNYSHQLNQFLITYNISKDLYSTIASLNMFYLYLGNIRLNVQYARNESRFEILARNQKGGIIDNADESKAFTIEYKIIADETASENLPANLIEENIGEGYNANLNKLIVATPEYDSGFSAHKFVISSLYNYKIYFNILLADGRRIENVLVNGNTEYDINSYVGTHKEKTIKFAEDLSLFTEKEYLLNQNYQMMVSVGELVATKDFASNANGIYEINNANDLMAYKQLLQYDSTNTISAVLTNNINITGYKFNIEELKGTLDGNYYTINGFTSYSPSEYATENISELSFIKNNYGVLKNINFDNVAINLKSLSNTFALINHNYRIIENTSLLGGYIKVNINQKTLGIVASLVGVNTKLPEGTLEGDNTNKIENVLSKAEIHVTTTLTDEQFNEYILSLEDYPHYYIGGVIGKQSAKVDGIEFDGKLIIEDKLLQKTNRVSIGMLIGYVTKDLEDGRIEIYNGINRHTFESICFNNFGYVIGGVELESNQKSSLYLENIVNFAKVTEDKQLISKDIKLNSNGELFDSGYTNVVVSSIKEFTGYVNYLNLNKYLSDNFVDSKFVLAYEYSNNLTETPKAKMLLPFTVQLIDVSTKLNENTVSTGIISKVNGFGNSFDNSFRLYQPLTNQVMFNSNENTTLTQELTFVLQVLCKGREGEEYIVSTSYFNFEDSGTVFTTRTPKIDIKHYDYEGKEVIADYQVKWLQATAEFTDEEITKILEGLNIIINGNEAEIDIELVHADEAYVYYAISIKDTIRFNDNIIFDIDLPTLAKLHSANGIKVENNLINDSLGKRYYQYQLELNKNHSHFANFSEFYYDNKNTSDVNDDETLILLPNVIAEIERSAIGIIFNLNKNELFESEKEFIEFSTEFIETKNQEAGEEIIQLNSNGDILNYAIIPLYINGDYVYDTPNINGILDYEYNGVHYSFVGFKDENGKMYYDENLNIKEPNITESIILYAEWKAEEYKIKVDTLNNACYITSSNGYNSQVEKVIKFGDNVILPKIDRKINASSYIFNGYTLNDDYISTGTFNTSTNLSQEDTILDMYRYFDDKYIANADANRVVLVTPKYSEVVYNLEFRPNKINDGYETYLIYNNNQYDAVEMNFTISTMKDLVLPVAFKEHHDFTKYIRQDDYDDFINYDKEIQIFTQYIKNGWDVTSEKEKLLVLNYGENVNENVSYNFADGKFYYNFTNVFIANYEIRKVEVKIYNVDFNNTNNILDYEVDKYNSLSDITITENIETLEDKQVKVITFKVDYNTTGITLPKITCLDDNYLFDGYKAQTSDSEYVKYNIAYVYKGYEDSDGTYQYKVNIYLLAKYKIIYFTSDGVISSDYSLDISKTSSDEYIYYAEFDSTVVLPTKEEVYLEGHNLTGYRVLEGDKTTKLTLENNEIIIKEPTDVIFEYDLELFIITIDSNGGIFPETINVNAFKVISEYKFIDESTIKIVVAYGTMAQEIIAVLPVLTVDYYTHVGYYFEQETITRDDDNAYAQFVKNEYRIEIYDYNKSLSLSIIKNIDDLTIPETFVSSIISGLTYVGLSFSDQYFNKFELPEIMPDLHKEYNVEASGILGNVYTLNVYAYYISHVNVTIKGYANSMIENTTNLNEFKLGYAWGADAQFVLTTENILNKNFVLPIPKVENELLLAKFTGYYTLIDGDSIKVADENGYVLDTFVYKENLELMQGFEYPEIDFVIYAGENVHASNLNGFNKTVEGYCKKVKINELIGTLPELYTSNYIFKGFYLASDGNKNIFVTNYDILIADTNGVLLEDYEKLTGLYFNENLTLKTIVAKFDYDYMTVTITSTNINLGLVNPIKDINGVELLNASVENGYTVEVSRGSSIEISTKVNENIGTFKRFVLSTGEEIHSEISIINDIQEDLVIQAEFDYIEFTITYLIDGEIVTNFVNSNKEIIDLIPSTYNFDTETFSLPLYEKAGYNFMGWYTTLTENGNYLNQVTEIIKNSSNDIVLYGKLEEKVITINIFDNKDGYVELVNSIQETYNKIITNLPTPKEGYFIGYFTEKDARGLKIDNGSLCIFTNDVNIYAYYVEDINPVSFKGQGTISNPYQISNEQEFEYFAYLMNTSSGYNNENVNYILTNNLRLTKEVYINNFKASFDGDGYVLYLNNKIISFNEVLSEGTIERKIGLFNENEGTIANLILVVNQNQFNDLDLAEDIKLGTIAGINYGTILNCLVYYNITIDGENITFNSISNNEELGIIENCSEYESKITINTNLEEYNNIQDIHVHNKNVAEPIKEDGKYLIKTSTELAYLLSLDACEEEIVLLNNIDMKGKVLESVNYSIKLNGNGYVISNLIVLNRNNIFNNIASLSNVGLENIVNINLNADSDIINVSNSISKVYIVESISTHKNIINTNEGVIINSYFITKQADNLVFVNNGTLENVYKLSGSLISTNNGNLTNAVVFDLTNASIDSEIEEFVSLGNEDSDNWFVDKNNIMGNGNLPALINIGNYVFELEYNADVIELQTNPYNLINNRFIAKASVELNLTWNMLKEEYGVTDVLIDSVSYSEKMEYLKLNILTYEFEGNYHKVEVITEIKEYLVTYIASEGGKVEVDELLYSEYQSSVVSGSKVKVKAVAEEGYEFVNWSDGIKELEREDIIISNLTLTANFKKLNKYNLIIEKDVFINETVLNEKTTWTKTEQVQFEGTESEREVYIYTTYLSQAITTTDIVENYLPIPVKTDYIFYYFELIQAVNGNSVLYNEFNINPIFEIDIQYIFLTFDSDLVEVNLTIDDEDNISENSGLEILTYYEIENGESYYTILNGYEVNINFTPKNSYLTELLINRENVIEDYSIYYNKDEEFVIKHTITELTEISITMSMVNLTTIFEFDKDFVNIMLENASINAKNEVIFGKNCELLFKLEFVEGYELDKFEIYDNEDNLLEVEITSTDDVYSYLLLQNAKIKIIHKAEIFNVEVLAISGGEVIADIEDINVIEDTKYETAFKFEVDYKKGFKIYINPFANYIISQVKVNDKVVKSTQILEYLQITSDTKIIIEFERVETWLDPYANGSFKFDITTFAGLGTKASPYLISRVSDLLTIAYKVNKENKDFTNTYFKTSKANLELDFYEYYFEPIGTDITSFNGVILGDNLTLKNINITGGSNIGLFKTLGENAIIKGITLSGTITGNDLVGSFAGTNNGKLEGVTNNIQINTYNGVNRDTNIVGGIVAVNNGTITRSNNNAKINSTAVKVGGIAAVNNGSINNIYNEGQIVSSLEHATLFAGIVAENKGEVEFGYNNSRIYSSVNNASIIISGTSYDTTGVSNELYYSTDRLLATHGEGKSYNELKGIASITNTLYENWDFETIWYFNEQYYDLPRLQIAHEFKANITFNVEFGEGFEEVEKIVIVEVSNGANLNYCLVLSGNHKTETLKDLIAGGYSVKVTSLMGTRILLDNSEILLEEETKDVNVTVKISKTTKTGYTASVII